MMKRIFLLLFSVLAMTKLVTGNRNETLPKPHVIIVGPTGAGKSSLACSLIGGNPTSENCLFPVCDDMDSCTKNTSYCGNSTWIGEESNPLFTVVDTPGFGDTDNEMDKLLEEMTKVLNEDIKTADVVLLTIESSTVKFKPDLIDMLKQLEMLFGRVMWNSTLVEVSKFSYKQSEIDEREEACEDPELPCRDEEFFYNEINREIEENFHIGMNLSMVFIDSYARRNASMDDEVQQEHFIAETDKLWNFALNSSEFKFKTIDQVLVENAIMREELICLNGIINDDLENLTEMLEQETIERKMNDNSIVVALEQESADRQTSVDTLSFELAGNVTVLQKNITEVADDVGELILSPIGSIVAWVTKPEKDATHEVLQLPDGWLECDGRPIPEPSIWAGGHTPNLNVEGRFLRGGPQDTQLTMEEDSFQDHVHEDGGHYHSASSSTHVTTDYFEFDDQYCNQVYSQADDSNDVHHFHCPELDVTHHRYDPKVDVDVTVSVLQTSSNIGSVDSSYRIGSETKPKNMNVIWIMRVW